jgi:hypothetical protein
MSIPYHDYETQIFNRLQTYRETHPEFTFSVRQNGSKGSERDYFIGTYKSRYFGFTCWDIPISFPGSSSDCVDFFFNYGGDGRPGFYMEASAPKKAGNDQLAACVAFVYNLRKFAGQRGLPVGANADDKKFIDYYLVPEPKQIVQPSCRILKNLKSPLNLFLCLILSRIQSKHSMKE